MVASTTTAAAPARTTTTMVTRTTEDDGGGEDDEEDDNGRGGGVADRLRAYGGGSGLGAKPGRKREKQHLAWRERHELKK
jgi:hypothetical protein